MHYNVISQSLGKAGSGSGGGGQLIPLKFGVDDKTIAHNAIFCVVS